MPDKEPEIEEKRLCVEVRLPDGQEIQEISFWTWEGRNRERALKWAHRLVEVWRAQDR